MVPSSHHHTCTTTTEHHRNQQNQLSETINTTSFVYCNGAWMEEREERIQFRSVDGLKLYGILHKSAIKPNGNILMLHGITVDRNEEGLFTKTARRFCRNGYNVFRFDFRGHGESEGKQEDMTIIGEILDIDAAFTFLNAYQNLPTGMLIASFGAASGVIYAANKFGIACIVLWNPVLDLIKTFIHPVLPWGHASFNREGFKHLTEKGYLVLDNNFKVGAHLIWEMKLIKPYEYMKMIKCPVITMHGDQDTYVPFDVSERYYQCNPNSDFIPIFGSEHGFGKAQDQEIVINRSLDWFKKYLH